MFLWMWRIEPFNSLMFALNLDRVHGVSALIFFIPQSLIEMHPDNKSFLVSALYMIRYSYPEADFKLINHHISDCRSDPYTLGDYSSFAIGNGNG